MHILWKSLSALIAAAGVLLAGSQSVPAEEVLYGITFDNRLFTIDTADGSGTVMLQEKFQADSFLGALSAEVTRVAMVPTMMRALSVN